MALWTLFAVAPVALMNTNLIASTLMAFVLHFFVLTKLIVFTIPTVAPLLIMLTNLSATTVPAEVSL